MQRVTLNCYPGMLTSRDRICCAVGSAQSPFQSVQSLSRAQARNSCSVLKTCLASGRELTIDGHIALTLRRHVRLLTSHGHQQEHTSSRTWRKSLGVNRHAVAGLPATEFESRFMITALPQLRHNQRPVKLWEVSYLKTRIKQRHESQLMWLLT